MSIRRRESQSVIMNSHGLNLHSDSFRSLVVAEGPTNSVDNLHKASSDDNKYGSSGIVYRRTSTTTNSVSDPSFPYNITNESVSSLETTHRGRNLKTIDIETTLTGEIGGVGVMFDIRTKSDRAVRIRSLTFHAKEAVADCKVKVFIKDGTHRDFETDSTAWTKIVDTVMECKGSQTDSVITSSMFDPSLINELIIEANSIRAVYIDSHDNYLRYSLTHNVDKVFSEDNYVQILEGTGLSRYFGDLHNPRMWNGLLTYELVASEEKYGCAGSISNPSNDSIQTYGHMFDIGSNYPGGIIIEGIEFQTHEDTLLNYEIYSISNTYHNFLSKNIDDWSLVAKGSITGGGAGARTAIVGTDFTPVTIATKSTRGFYITLDTQNLRYAESPAHVVGDIFANNDHISLAVGVGVADYPLGKNFFHPRQWGGKVLYRTAVICPEPTFVDYIYEVQYPKNLKGDPLLEEVDKIVNSFVQNFIETNPKLKSLEEESGNSIRLLSTETNINGGSSSSCESASQSSLCHTLVTRIDVGSFSQSDVGYIEYLLLQQNTAVSDAISFDSSEGTLSANYVGDEVIDTKTQLILKGVGSSTMGPKESAHLREVVKHFLNKKFGVSGVEVLRVWVIKIDTLHSRLLGENKLVVDASRVGRNLADSTSDITVQIGISAKHRPPPDINFNSIVDDAINTKPEELRNDLVSESVDKGVPYFRDLQQVKGIAILPDSTADIPNNMNLDSPTLAPSYKVHPSSSDIEEDGLGSTMLIVIIAAVATLGLVFGSYVVYKAVRKKRTAKDEQEPENRLFEEPILDNWSQHSEENTYEKDASKPVRISGTSTASMSSNSFHISGKYAQDSDPEHLGILGMHDTRHDTASREGIYSENRRFYEQHRPSLDHKRPTDFDSNSIISGRSGRSARTGRSSRRGYSPSGRSRTSSRRTNSPSGRSASSRRTHSPSGRSLSSRRTHSPSGRSMASSRRTHSPSGRSKRSSRRTHSPSGRSRTSSRRANSPVVSASVRSMSRTADHGEGSVYSKDSRMTGNKSTKSGYKAVHGCDPPARRKKPSNRSFASENEEDEKAGLVRISTGNSTKGYRPASDKKQPHNLGNDRTPSRASSRHGRDVNDAIPDRASSRNRNDSSSKRNKIVRTPSIERSMASDSTDSTISTKGRAIPGKSYH